MLDTLGTLRARAHQGLRATRLRVGRSVALAIVIALFAPMAHANTGSIDAYKYDPRKYINATMNKTEAKCIKLLISKESAWNHKAIGNLSSPTKSYVYGLLQIKNPIAKDMNPMQQIQLHMRYLDHRYDGSACKAWEHFKLRNWH
jgi:soluble lytic murein transglycosylase-like protein